MQPVSFVRLSVMATFSIHVSTFIRLCKCTRASYVRRCSLRNPRVVYLIYISRDPLEKRKPDETRMKQRSRRNERRPVIERGNKNDASRLLLPRTKTDICTRSPCPTGNEGLVVGAIMRWRVNSSRCYNGPGTMIRASLICSNINTRSF